MDNSTPGTDLRVDPDTAGIDAPDIVTEENVAESDTAGPAADQYMTELHRQQKMRERMRDEAGSLRFLQIVTCLLGFFMLMAGWCGIYYAYMAITILLWGTADILEDASRGGIFDGSSGMPAIAGVLPGFCAGLVMSTLLQYTAGAGADVQAALLMASLALGVLACTAVRHISWAIRMRFLEKGHAVDMEYRQGIRSIGRETVQDCTLAQREA